MRRLINSAFFYGQIFMVCIVGILLGGCSVWSAKTQELSSVKSDSISENSKPIEANSNFSPIQNSEVLWDFRKTEDNIQKFPKAETKAVFTYLFSDKWDEELTITNRVQGSFTQPNANETLYYVGGCDEGDGFVSTQNCAHASWWNAGRIAIYNGTTPVMKTEAALGYEIAKVTDVNGDKINEILSLSGFSNMGATETGAALGQIKNDKYEEIKTFAGYSDSCAEEAKSKQIAKAAVISFIPAFDGKIPKFTEEYFQNRCGNSPWKTITKKQFEGE